MLPHRLWPQRVLAHINLVNSLPGFVVSFYIHSRIQRGKKGVTPIEAFTIIFLLSVLLLESCPATFSCLSLYEFWSLSPQLVEITVLCPRFLSLLSNSDCASRQEVGVIRWPYSSLVCFPYFRDHSPALLLSNFENSCFMYFVQIFSF